MANVLLRWETMYNVVTRAFSDWEYCTRKTIIDLRMKALYSIRAPGPDVVPMPWLILGAVGVAGDKRRRRIDAWGSFLHGMILGGDYIEGTMIRRQLRGFIMMCSSCQYDEIDITRKMAQSRETDDMFESHVKEGVSRWSFSRMLYILNQDKWYQDEWHACPMCCRLKTLYECHENRCFKPTHGGSSSSRTGRWRK